MSRLLPFLCGCMMLLVSCEGFFGKRTGTDFLDVPLYDNRPVAYVPLQPVWDGLEYPADIIVGFDELIYVADSGSSEIISFDESGNELGRFVIPGLSRIAQDRRLNILATGTIDTLINGTPFTLAALYRLNLNANPSEGYGLNQAAIDTVIVHPFYFRTGEPALSTQNVRFTGIATLWDNSYYLGRTGPSNLSTQFGGPDNSVQIFNSDDEWVTPVSVFTSLGLRRDYFQEPASLTGFFLPPQRDFDPRTFSTPNPDAEKQFIFTSQQPDLLLSVQRINFEVGPGGAAYVLDPDFAIPPGRFDYPADVSLTSDASSVLIVDAVRDSLYQFTLDGIEGINSPPGASVQGIIPVSFGGTGSTLTEFREPKGVAFLNDIVYVADAGNGRVLRFRLTTDFD